MRLSAVGRKIEFGDFLLLTYALVFIREYAWIVPNDFAAWTITITITLFAWVAYLNFKPQSEERTPRLFWVTVALPLLIIYSLRAMIPDLSFDVLNHRLIQGERALRGPQFLPGDFFPTVFPFNPSSDMLTGLYRHLLGYRLGTMINLLALIWAGTILEKMLRPWFARAWQRCVGVLLILFTEHVLFEINNYMVDLLALPLMLEATRLALGYDESKTKRWDLCWSALLLGGAVGLKLTNAAMVVPIVIIFAFRLIATRQDKRVFAYLIVAAILFLLPLLPHAVYIYRETGSPFFPLYNNIFRSPLWPEMALSDGRWGPRSWIETLSWPLVSFWVPQRLSELAVYAGRLSLTFVVAPLCVLLPRIPARIRLIGLTCILGSLMWSATSGYIRYGLFIEILGGVLLLYLSIYILRQLHAVPSAIRIGAAIMPLALLLAQCVLSASYVQQTEWSKRRIESVKTIAKELQWVWLDRDLGNFQSAEDLQRFSQVDAWIVSSVKSNGVEVLLRPDVPMLAVNYSEYFDRRESRRRFARELERLRGKRVYSLTLTDELDAARGFLRQRNLGVGQMQDVVIPFFSLRNQFHMTMIEILLPEMSGPQRRPPSQPDVTDATGPLNDDAFVAELSANGVPAVMSPGQAVHVTVEVRNVSDYFWPSRNRESSRFTISAADVWLRPDAHTLVNNLDGRTSLPRDLWPGESATVQLTIKAPDKPGDYVLEIDLVQEGVTFFKDKGFTTWRAKVKVE